MEEVLRSNRILNVVAASKHFPPVLRDWFVLRRFRASLSKIARENRPSGGISAIHFVYGFKQVEEFPLYAFMAVLSAQAHHPSARVFFYVHHEPYGRYWDLIKNRIQIVHTPNFEWFGNAKLSHYAHKADVIRLLAIQEIGGLYLDCDTITIANMDHLGGHDFVLGVQQTIPGAMGGFCNAIMIASPQSIFGKRWLSQYRSFNSKGRDAFWDFHSVKLPMYLYAKDPSHVTVLHHDKWFFPLWNHIYYMMFSVKDLDSTRGLFEGQLAVHLWHNMIASTLDTLSPQAISTERCHYSEFCYRALMLLRAADRADICSSLGLDFSSLAASYEYPSTLNRDREPSKLELM
jgi:hypothetical protein